MIAAVFRRLTCTFFSGLLAPLLLLASSAVAADADIPTKWKTGPEFRKAADESVGVSWADLTLREATQSLARTQEVCIWLDRRVNPDQSLHFTARGEPLQQLLERMANERRLGVSVLGSLFCLAPREAATNLATLAALRRKEASELPAKGKAAWLKQAALSWPELSEPRELAQRLATAAGATIANPEQIPHDLWPAAHWPPLPACDRLTLLLAGFGLTFELEQDGAVVRLLEIPKVVEYRNAYSTRGDVAKVLADIQRILPEVQVKRQGNQLLVSGRYEDHERVERLLRGETIKTTKVAVGEKRFTVNVEKQPAGAVVKRIAADTNREFKFAPEVVSQLNEPVTFRVSNATLDELLKATLGPVGLKARVSEEAIEIGPP